MEEKLYQTLKNYADSKPIRFHMPAHNGEDIGLSVDMDITELSFSDNLISSDGVIANTEANIAKAYNVPYAIMLTCGATNGVAIALHTAKQFGNELLIVGDCHKSVYNYANIFGFKISKIDKLNTNTNYNKFAAIIITTPNYFGKTFDLSPLNGTTALVIADCSHGSHFAFSSELPNLDTKIADITILSFHKTLPVLSGGAGVLCKDKKIYDLLCYSRSLLHSSSPNYLIMASIDKAICKFDNSGEKLFEEVINSIKSFEQLLDKRYSVMQTDDISRLCICLNGISADSVQKLLEQQNIFIEMAYCDILVLIVTPFNCKHLQTLANVLNILHCTDIYAPINAPKCVKIGVKSQKMAFCDIDEALDKTSASNVGIYPPGTPIIHIGDKITKEILEILQRNDLEIFGLTNGKIAVFIEE